MNCQSYYPCRPQQDERELSDFFPEGYKIRPAYEKYPYYLSIPFQAERDNDEDDCHGHGHHHCQCYCCPCCCCHCWNCPCNPYYRGNGSNCGGNCNGNYGGNCGGNVNYHHVQCSCNNCRCQNRGC